jgi:acyl dehydratase
VRGHALPGRVRARVIDRRFIGHRLEPFTVDVERGRLRFFAEATGQAATDVVPPTYFFCLEMESPNPAAIRELLGMDYRRILHGEQGFTYHAPARAGDRLTFTQRIADIYDKKNGALEFVVRETGVTNQRGEHVADMRCVTVYRPTPEAPAAPPPQGGATSGPAKPDPRWPATDAAISLPPLELPPITRHMLALYCGASGDHNPIHVDIDFAKSAGLPDVFAHGMLSAAWLGRLLTNWVPQSAIRSLDMRFVAITQVHERITCTGEVTEKFGQDGERLARVKLATRNERGETKLTGEALVAWETT